MMGGLQKSDLVILAGRPGMGKTALATNIAYNIARAWRRRGAGRRPHRPRSTAASSASSRSKCRPSSSPPASSPSRPKFPPTASAAARSIPTDFDRIAETAREMESLPLYIDETGGLSIAQLAARARRLKRQRGLDLLVVDYIQLLQGSSRRAAEGRVQEVTEITTSLKALAKELNVPIVALSQLSRQVENRDDKRPQLSDLRESGSIEQDADVVMFVFREEYYLSNGAAPRHRRAFQVAGRDGSWSTARPRSSSASSATARPAPCIAVQGRRHPLRRPRRRRPSAGPALDVRSGHAPSFRRHMTSILPDALGRSSMLFSRRKVSAQSPNPASASDWSSP